MIEDYINDKYLCGFQVRKMSKRVNYFKKLLSNEIPLYPLAIQMSVIGLI